MGRVLTFSMRLSNILRKSIGKIDFAKSVPTRELDILASEYEKSLANPVLFPTHIQKLHTLASQVRTEREFLGISQSDLEANRSSLQKAERVVYAIYDKLNPEFYFVASRDPAAFDFYRLYLNSVKESRDNDRISPLSRWISKHDFAALGLYLVESINTTKISFRKIAKARLLFWRSYQFISLRS